MQHGAGQPLTDHPGTCAWSPGSASTFPGDEQNKELGMSQSTATGGAAPATMRAVVVTRPGGLDALEIKDVPLPVRKPGWVRIRVKAFGVKGSEVPICGLPAARIGRPATHRSRMLRIRGVLAGQVG